MSVKVTIKTVSSKGFSLTTSTTIYKQSEPLTVNRAIALLDLIEHNDKLASMEIKEEQ